ncbi:MAG: Tol-Pal system beta propeller repeat protein TolB [Gammaproteobacteria bacterium]|nr:Tol-Pal system beta propeller repeat protein TolB [Gammaproteobacteria bacterium]
MKQILTLCCVLLCTWAIPSYAILNVEITQGTEDALPIAIIPFSWESEEKQPDLSSFKVISTDLLRSGRFAPVPEDKLLSRPTSTENLDFKSWKVAGVDHLVVGSVRPAGNNQFAVKFQLFDVFKGEQLLGYSLTSDGDSLRYTAHHISDLIYQQLTGQKGAFNTKVAYVTVSRDQKGDSYKLEVSDTDGFNPVTILTSSQPIMSPSWSPDGTRLAYVSFEKRRAQIYTQILSSGERLKVSEFRGLNGAPVWSPDGKKLAMTLSKDGNADIYVLRLEDKKLSRLTKHWGIDTEPSWMPDSQSLVFTSNRSGKPQLYKINGAGIKPRRLTFEGSYNSSAEISKDGQKLAFVYKDSSGFKIATMDLETGVIDVLTEGPLDESPSFAPNGSMILYAEGQRAALAAVSSDGRFKQRLVAKEGEVREPTWSPFLK